MDEIRAGSLSLPANADYNTKITELDKKIKKVTSSLFYQFFGWGASSLQSNIAELNTITSKITSLENGGGVY